MLGFVFRIFIFLSLLTVTFAGTRGIVRALPGNPIETLMAETGTTLPRELLNRELGLDQPFWPSVGRDLGRSLRGDFGISILSKKPIAPLLWLRFQKTFELTMLTTFLGLIISLWIGLIAAAHPNAFMDRFCTFTGALTAALPTTWLGPMILFTFAVWLPIFPVGGHPLLPAITLAFGFSGLWSRMIRKRARETILHGAVVGARARGISEPIVLIKYALAPASGALLAYLGTQVGALMTGAYIVEIIFDWRGLGHLLVDSVLKRDYPVVEAATFVTAALSLLGTFLGDWAQRSLDPRIQEADHL